MKEAAKGCKNIAAFFGRKAPKNRAGGPISSKRQRGGTSNRCELNTSTPAMEKSTENMAKAKEKTKVKPVRVQAFHKKKKAERAKLCSVYLRKV